MHLTDFFIFWTERSKVKVTRAVWIFESTQHYFTSLCSTFAGAMCCYTEGG